MTNQTTLAVDQDLLEKVKYNEKSLVPGIVQDMHSGEILMQAYMNKESLKKTIETGNATFWSRSRQKLWMKGETSGNIMKVQGLLIDCDEDSLVLLVNPEGPACHTGDRTCYHRVLAKNEDMQKSGCKGCGEGCCG